MIKLFFHYNRGKTFRTDFSQISEIRSLLPKWTNIMALTATANLATQKMVIQSLEMNGYYTSRQGIQTRGTYDTQLQKNLLMF